MKPSDVEALVTEQLLPKWRRSLETLDLIDGWLNPRRDRRKFPLSRRANYEHRALQELSEAPWGAIVVSTVAQTLDLESIYTEQADDPAVARIWAPWKRNRMDRVQVRLHRGSIAFGEAYTRVTRGDDSKALINARSARDAFVVYRDSRDDDAKPLYALEKVGQWDLSNPLDPGLLMLWDEDGTVYTLSCEAGDIRYVEQNPFDYGVVPFIRYAPQLDLEGVSRGEIAPLVPLFGRIEKTAYDRLLIQHKNSWKVRTATGLDGDKLTEQDKIKLAHDDILTGEEGVQFSTLDETSVEPTIKAHEADIDVLSALSQTPITALGKFINVSADAIAEARASLYAKRDEYRKMIGVSHLDTLRLAAHIEGRTEDAANFDIYADWADTEVRTMSAAADALGKVATMLEVPVTELWPMLPFVNYTMAEKWKSAATRQGGESLIQQMIAARQSATQTQQASQAGGSGGVDRG
jgi:hypothetical protein